MKQEHLSENELQQFALEQQEANSELAAHVHECAKCSTAIANYQAMFAALSSMEKPVFDFDPEKQVLAQLPVSTTAKSGFPWSLLLLSTIAVTIIAITLFVMRSSFKNLFKGIPEMMLYIMVVTTLTIIIFQCREMLASYQKKMNLLRSY
jgi:anti-sigma factor RsiW